jgi:hypothetical protein
MIALEVIGVRAPPELATVGEGEAAQGIGFL